MGNLKNFQLVMVVLFAFGGILGVFVFAGFIDLGGKTVNSGPVGTVTVWGTIPSNIISPLISEINDRETFRLKYVQKDINTFNSDLLEALAIDKGPDLFFVSDSLLLDNIDKISKIQYKNYPLISFKNNFASAGEVFLTGQGILAMPIIIDPLMLYYNRTLLDSNSIVYPPSYWDELPGLNKIFTKKDSTGQVFRSAFALGQIQNINYAKDIITAMFMQDKNEIVYLDGNVYRSAIQKTTDLENNIIDSLDLYLSFSNPLNENYSWNRSLKNSIDAFSQENLVFYFGFASDLKTLFNKNPNNNFGVAEIPQDRNAEKKTRGKVTGIAISSSTKNYNTSYVAMNVLVNGTFADKLSKSLGIPPARRDLLANKGIDAYNPVFYSSALFAKSFVNPGDKETDNIFRLMIEEVLSNGSDSKGAISNLSNRLNLLLLNQ